MKLSSLALLCLVSLSALTRPTLARRGMGGGGKSSGSRGSGTPSNRGGSTSGKVSGKTPPSQPASYPKQKDSNHYGTHHSGHPPPARVPAHPYHNPSNRLLSPGCGGSYGEGYRGAGGSPFARRVHGMGMGPSWGSRGFGRRAVLASSAGVVTVMALGYGLGRFPRLSLFFRSYHEERYYNHYMYRRYGELSTDANDYSQDYEYSPAPAAFAKKMDECMKNLDQLPSEMKPGKKGTTAAAAAIPAGTPAATPAPVPASPTLPRATDNSTSDNASKSNGAATHESASTDPRVSHATPPPTTEDLGRMGERLDDDDDDDETVSIVEIGYPALVEQVQSRLCVERYVAYTSSFLKKKQKKQVLHSGTQGLQTALAVVLSALCWGW